MAESQSKDSLNEGFIFDDHTIVTNLKSFLEKLKSLSEDDIRKYVNDNKNDFSNWISNSLNDKKLGTFISKEKSKEGIIGVLESYISMQEMKAEQKKAKPVKKEIKKTIKPKSVKKKPVKKKKEVKKSVKKETKRKKEIKKTVKAKVSTPKKKKTTTSIKKKITKPKSTKNVEKKAEKVKKTKPVKKEIKKTVKPKSVKKKQVAKKTVKSIVHKIKRIKKPKTQEPIQKVQVEKEKMSIAKKPTKQAEEVPQESQNSNNTNTYPEKEMRDVQAQQTQPKITGKDLLSEDDFGTPQQKQVPKEHAYVPKSTIVQGPAGKEEIISEKEAELASEELKKAVDEISKVCIGQYEVIEKVFLCLICNGHALLEGVPGLAKSLLVETFAQVVKNASFHRIQFMPDLLPSDIIGGQIYNPKTSTFSTYKGPIFANFILADEVNRAPPKTNAALMECMQEKKVNIDKDEFILDKPFLVLGTQNPLENKGTYELPEAILDRFMLKIILDYPSRKDEKIIITENSTTNTKLKKRAETVFTKERLLELQALTKRIFISDRIRDYIIDIVDATRGLNKNIEGFKFVKYGGGPRASIYLGIAAKSKALFEGRNYVMPDDVAFVAPDVLRHRICLNYNGKAHNISSDKIIEEILGIINPV